MDNRVILLKDARISDVEIVGGKNASLGEMIGALSDKGVRVPGGFATTADAFEEFLNHNNLKSKIDKLLKDLDTNQIKELTQVGAKIRNWVQRIRFPR